MVYCHQCITWCSIVSDDVIINVAVIIVTAARVIVTARRAGTVAGC